LAQIALRQYCQAPQGHLNEQLKYPTSAVFPSAEACVQEILSPSARMQTNSPPPARTLAAIDNFLLFNSRQVDYDDYFSHRSSFTGALVRLQPPPFPVR